MTVCAERHVGSHAWPFVVPMAVAIVAAFAAAYAETVATLVRHWLANDTYSHGFLVPLISAYLVWCRRAGLVTTPVQPSLGLGLPLLAGGLALLVGGHAGSVAVVQSLSILPTTAGLVLVLFGPSHLRRLAFPILFLLFMIPIWETLTGSLHEPFQLLAADLGSRVMRGLGIPAFREGTYIQLPTVILEIARVCSGVNYLIAVFATSIAASYLFLGTWPRRLTLILLAVLVAIFANSLRVALIGALSYYGYAGDSHGPYHVLQGVSVSFLGYGAIFAGLWALGPRRPSGRLAPGTSARTLPGPVESPWARWRETAMPSAGSALALLAAAAVVVQVWTPIPVELARNLQRFPAVLGQWSGQPSEPPLSVLAGMDADHELSRVYERPDARPVWLYIAYFAVQRQAREAVSYRSDALLAGSTRSTVSLPGAVRLTLNEAVLVEAGQRRLVRFWYDVDGRMVADPYRAKLLTLIDALVRRRSNGGLVVLAVDAPGTEDVGRARDTSQRFLEEAFPVIRRFLEGA